MRTKVIKRHVILFILMLILYGPALAQALQPFTGQYIRIELPGVERTLSLAEVRVYSGERNIVLQGKPSQSSTFSDAVAARAIDGKFDGGFFGGSVASTSAQANPWWELDLGSEKSITKVVIDNRTDCCSDRINPGRVFLLNKSKEVVWEGGIRSSQAQYEFSLAKSFDVDISGSRNLLRNATFKQRTNNSIPDYWDLHHVAALTFKNLHDQYGIEDSVKSPVPGAKVLRIVNTEDNFSYLNLMPRKFFSSLPDGEYTFSAYLKAERSGMEHKVTRAWAEGGPTIHKLTTAWTRYSATFSVVKKNSDTIQPIMFFPSRGTYYVSGPQLERGKTPTPFRPSIDDDIPENAAAALREQLKSLLASMSTKFSQYKQPPLSAVFDYDYYTSQQVAHLSISSQHSSDLRALIKCDDSARHRVPLPIQDEIVIRPLASIEIDVRVADLPVGNYTCLIDGTEGGVKRVVTTAKFNKFPPDSVEVRVNRHRRFISINGKPFYMIGMGVGNWKTPPDWYFRDIAGHGMNTVFYTRPPNPRGEYDIRDIEAFVSGAARHGLKVIIGLPLAGAKPANWRQRLAGFLKVVASLKHNNAVIGWYPVDEPAAVTWLDDELIEIYDAVKKADPYRLVFLNWAYDGVPVGVGQEPRGTLAASDMYSSDYYPFAGQRRTMDGFTSNTVRTIETARIHRKVPHSWIQIYGGMDAWREPTGDEIQYMVYLNLIYGGTVSYWDTKSNSSFTWDRLSEVNNVAKMLAEKLFMNSEAYEIVPPSVKENFFYSGWREGKTVVLIVVHSGNGTEEFVIDPAGIAGGRILGVKTLFKDTALLLSNGLIKEAFSPFAGKVYLLEIE